MIIGILDQDSGESDMTQTSERSSRSRAIVRSPANGFIKPPANGAISEQVYYVLLGL